MHNRSGRFFLARVVEMMILYDKSTTSHCFDFSCSPYRDEHPRIADIFVTRAPFLKVPATRADHWVSMDWWSYFVSDEEVKPWQISTIALLFLLHVARCGGQFGRSYFELWYFFFRCIRDIRPIMSKPRPHCQSGWRNLQNLWKSSKWLRCVWVHHVCMIK